MSQSQETTDGVTFELTKWADLTAFQRDLLREIGRCGGAEYGLAIKRSLETWGYETVNHGRLYPNLDTLENRDMVAKSELDRRTNEYALTELGSRVLNEGADQLDAVRTDGRHDSS